MPELTDIGPTAPTVDHVDSIQALLPAVFDTLADGVTVIDRAGTVRFINPAASRILGVAPPPELIGKSAAALASAFVVTDDGDAPFDPTQLPTHRALTGERAPESVIRFQAGDSREVRWSLVRARLLAGDTPDADLVVTSFQDITALVLEAQDAVRVRDEFMAIASHDMRTPLAAVRGYAQLARRHLAGEPSDIAPVERWLADIEESANRLTGLVSEFMDISLLQGGHAVPLQLQRVDLVELVTERVRDHEGSEERPHVFTVSSDSAEIVGIWDAQRLGRVVDNVLGNAVKFSPDGSTIEVRMWTENGVGYIAIVDEGIGVAERDHELIFSPMFRAANARAVAGTGLGLAGSRGIVALMGGEISVESKLGEGSTFTIRVPLDPGATSSLQAESGAQ